MPGRRSTAEDTVYLYGPTKKDGSPRKLRSAGTGWTAIVRRTDGSTRQFYGATEAEAEKAVGKWRMNGGWDGEEKSAEGRFHGRITTQREDGEPKEAGLWLAWWAANKRMEEWDDRRRSDAEALIRLHAAPYWQKTRFSEITEQRVQGLLDRLKDRPTTQDNLRRLLKVAFKDCRHLHPGLVPGVLRRKQREEQQKEERFRILTPEELARLDTAWRQSTDPLVTALIVTLDAGLRSSETRALKREDFDKATGTLHITRSVTRIGSRNELVELTKTTTSNRHIVLPSRASEILRLLCLPPGQAALAFFGLQGRPMSPEDYETPTGLFWPCTKGFSLGEPLDQSRLCKALDRLRKKAQIVKFACPHGCKAPLVDKPPTAAPDDRIILIGEQIEEAKRAWCFACPREAVTLRVHDLRHTNCTLMCESNVPDPVIMTRMGWKSAAMLARYSHRTAAGEEQAVVALENLATTNGHTERMAAIERAIPPIAAPKVPRTKSARSKRTRK